MRVMSLRAVIFDLGGVVVPSPIEAFRVYERSAGLPHRFISEVIVDSGDDGAWARLERGALSLEEFGREFEKECAAAGQVVRSEDMIGCLYASGGPRSEMLTAIARIREEGLKTAALTNNWAVDDTPDVSDRKLDMSERFDIVIESHAEGLRKPDPRIYELTCERLGVTPPESAFLDDLGVNLKPARAMGMTTIKVEDPQVALAELESALGFSLSEE